MNQNHEQISPNCNVFVRGSKSRLGREIVKALVQSKSMEGAIERDEYGGSFATLESIHPNNQNILVLSSGRSTPKSNAIECAREFADFMVMVKEFKANRLLTPGDILVFISSGGTVYGSGSGIKSESSSPNPLNAYGHLKLKQEDTLLSFAADLDVKCLILRLANAYSGTVVSPKGLIDSLLAFRQGSKPMSIAVSGKSRKQYGVFSDYANHSLLAINNFITSKDLVRVQNLFSQHSYSIFDITLQICEKRKLRLDEVCHFEYKEEIAVEDTVELSSKYLIDSSRYHWKSLEEVLETFGR
jgi:nucleoside-diphosphate-sugar epimerase